MDQIYRNGMISTYFLYVLFIKIQIIFITEREGEVSTESKSKISERQWHSVALIMSFIVIVTVSSGWISDFYLH